MKPKEHPSYLALDRLSLGLEQSDVQRHASECQRCQSHLRKMRDVAPLPSWLNDLESAGQRRFVRPWTLRVAAFGAPAAALVTILLFVLVAEKEPESGTRAKGAPTVVVFIKRGTDVREWNRKSAVLPEDEIRLQIAGAGYSYVKVYSIGPTGRRKKLFEGNLEPAKPTILPAAWRIDASANDEILELVLSNGPNSDPWNRWVQRLVLPKDAS